MSIPKMVSRFAAQATRIAGVSCLSLSLAAVTERPAQAAWINTPPAVGKVTNISVQYFQNLYYTAVTLSTPITNCSGSPTSVWIPKRQPNGGIAESHDNMLSVATAALLAGKTVAVWADTQTYTVFGQTQNVCILDQIQINN